MDFKIDRENNIIDFKKLPLYFKRIYGDKSDNICVIYKVSKNKVPIAIKNNGCISRDFIVNHDIFFGLCSQISKFEFYKIFFKYMTKSAIKNFSISINIQPKNIC